MGRKTVFLCCMIALAAAPVFAQEADRHAQVFEAKIKPIVAAHCLSCHSQAVEKPKGNLRLDRLTPNFADAANRDAWVAALKRVKAREMPPKSKERPPTKDLETLEAWIGDAVAAADARRAAEGRVVLRRLNRVEYENTVRDLLGIHVDLKEQLPIDGSAGGFDNVGDALHISSFLMERYLEAAELALKVAIANGSQPQLIKKRYSLKDQHGVKGSTERVFRKIDNTVVLFSSSHWNAVSLHEFYPPHSGRYRIKISASGFQSGDKAVTYRVDAGHLGMTGKSHLVGYFDAPPDKETVVEWVDYLEARSSVRVLPYGLANAGTVHKIGADDYQGAGLAVQGIEIEGPLHDVWPPANHRRIFGDLPQQAMAGPNGSKRFEVVSQDPEADAERIVRAFARRAFRRAVTDDDVKPLLDLVKSRLQDKYTFEQAVRVGLLGAMVSPNFLFLRERPGKLDDFALASRLSYFLWSTMPDDELLMLAEQGKLGDAATLRAQVERMLKDPKAAAFTENFVGQWLGLRDIDATIPSHVLYPEYDDMLKASMLKETYLFWDEVLKHDLSLTNFIHSDFSMLNGRLARHYGITADGQKTPAGIWEFSKWSLPKDSHRGGVLTMASVLKVTANGTYTSPILRGAWVLERILGAPPPRPPEGVSAVEPDIRGTTTIRDQLAKHRSVAACASCHVKIDPPGFALESFDVIGGWRDYYRSTGNGKTVFEGSRRMPYLQGKKVDPADVLEDGRAFQNIDEFRQLLLRDKEQIARTLTEKLATYASGAAVQPGDRSEIDAIVRKIRDRDYGLRTLVHEIVQSRLFQAK